MYLYQIFLSINSLADSLNILDPDELDLCAIVWTVANYVVANLEDQLPREGAYPTKPPSAATSVLPSFFVFGITASVGVYYNNHVY